MRFRSDAGMLIKKPWRVAYVNSTLGDRLNLKCDGTHVHTSCSGRNTSETERYAPEIARVVHECFASDTGCNRRRACACVRIHSPAAVSRVEGDPGPGGQSGNAMNADLDLDTWPILQTAAVGAREGPKRRGSAKARGKGATANMAQSSNSSKNAGNDSKNAAGSLSDNVDGAVGTEGAQDGGQEHFKITGARFIPTLRDMVQLIDELYQCYDTPSKMYHWLKGAILSCAYIVPE